MSDWLITRILSNAFPVMERELDRRSIKHCYPQCKVRQVRGGCYVTEVQPILSDYLFVRSPKYWYYLLDLPGLLTIVRSSITDLPYRSKVLDREVEDLLQTRGPDGLYPAPDLMKIKQRLTKFVKGDSVHIVTGVGRGVSGTVEDVSDAKVLVSAGEFRIRVAEDDVIALSPDDAFMLHLSKGKKRRLRHLQEKVNAA